MSKLSLHCRDRTAILAWPTGLQVTCGVGGEHFCVRKGPRLPLESGPSPSGLPLPSHPANVSSFRLLGPGSERNPHCTLTPYPLPPQSILIAQMKPQRTQSSSHQSKTCPEDKPPAWVVFAKQKMKRWFCFPAVPQRKHPRKK